MKLYVKKYEKLLGGLVSPEKDPLKDVCSIGKSDGRHNVLRELKLVEAGGS